MKSATLRFKVIAAILLTGLIMTLVLGVAWYPMEINRRQAGLARVELLITSVFQQKRETLANDIYARHKEALQAAADEMLQVQGIASVSIYDLSGAMIMATDTFATVVLSEQERQAMASGPSFNQTPGPRGLQTIFTTPVEILGQKAGYLRIHYDLTDIEEESRLTLIYFLFLAISLLVVMAVSLDRLLSRLVLVPVARLRQAMRQVQAGQLGHQVSLASRDEIGEMAEAFNEMSTQLEVSGRALNQAIQSQQDYATQLAETNAALERLNRDLEKMVESRTHQLTHTNTQLQAEIHDRVRAEADLATEKERLAVTLRSLADGVITTDTLGRIDLLNEAAGEITGWESELALGRSVEEVFHLDPEERQSWSQHPMRESIRKGLPFTSHKPVQVCDRQGRGKVVTFSVAPIRTGLGQVSGAVVVFRDVTEQELMEREAERSARIEALGIMAGGIAHDFNNIMTAVLGNLSLVRQHISDTDLTRRLLEAEKASMKAKGLTQQLLTFSKGGAPIKTATSIPELLEDTVNFTLSGSKVVERFEFADKLWLLNIDPSQISQVINNLVLNAIQAMPDGGLILVRAYNIFLHPEDEGYLPLNSGRYVVISLRDEGVGIPEEMVGKIFDPYFTTKERGSGLGLATSYSIVKNHGGHLEVLSQVGRGTTFNIYLPAADQETRAEKNHRDPMVPGQGRILVMDDEEAILDMIREALGFIGYGVETATDGRQAIEKFKAAQVAGQGYDLVIMDLTIPGGMGGKEAIKHLLALDPGVRAIVSSGYSQDPVMADYESFGFLGVLPKPFRIEELSQTLNRVLTE